MRTISLFVLCLAGLLAVSRATAQDIDLGTMSPAGRVLLQDYRAYDGRCRGGSGDNSETWVACGARDYIGVLLNDAGYCLGEKDQPGFEMVWHVCTPNSNRLEKP